MATSDVNGWVGLWLRVDAAVQRVLAFDNMGTRPIRGTTEWIRYEIVLSVHALAATVNFGILINGRGVAWIDDVRMRLVTETE